MREHDIIVSALRSLLARMLPPQPHVLIACMPKSGSSFLTQALAALPGMCKVHLVPGYERREQEFDVTRLAKHSLRSYISQQHIRYSETVKLQIQQFGIRPVVLTRNLFDVVASLRDHVRNESPKMSMAWLTDEHAALPDHELDLVIADLVMPWYVQFFVSWKDCPEALWIDYEEVRTRPGAVVRRVVAHGRINATDDEINRAVAGAAAAPKRLNKGVQGRGADIFSLARQRIEEFIRCYPEVDFSAVELIRHRRPAAPHWAKGNAASQSCALTA